MNSLILAEGEALDSQHKRLKVRVAVKAELTVEGESEDAIRRWLASFTFTDACTEHCLYSVRVTRGAVNADLWYDPAEVREEVQAAIVEVVE